MLTLRCTKRLLTRIRRAPESAAPRSTTILGDWYANLVFVGRRQLVLFTSERSLQPVLVEAKESATLFDRFRHGLADVLRAVDIPQAAIEKELRDMVDVTIAKTAGRTVLGTMSDFTWMTRFELERGASLLEVALFLAESPCSPIDGFPCDLTRTLFGLKPRRQLSALRVVH